VRVSLAPATKIAIEYCACGYVPGVDDDAQSSDGSDSRNTHGGAKVRIRRAITLTVVAAIPISYLIGFPFGILASVVALGIIALKNGMRFMDVAFLFGLACFPLAYFVSWWLLVWAFAITFGMIKGQAMRNGMIFYPQRSTFFFFWW
jgi:hypothetical protein